MLSMIAANTVESEGVALRHALVSELEPIGAKWWSKFIKAYQASHSSDPYKVYCRDANGALVEKDWVWHYFTTLIRTSRMKESFNHPGAPVDAVEELLAVEVLPEDPSDTIFNGSGFKACSKLCSCPEAIHSALSRKSSATYRIDPK